MPPLSGAVPSETPSSVNCTVPVARDGVTVAISVSGWPASGAALSMLKARVVANLTTCETAGLVLPR